MRPDEERALYGFADDDGRPDPADAQTAAEYVALLGAFVEASGLSLSEIEEVARSKGYVLPEGILATALSHDALPPERLVVALVRSIGINDREVKYWAEALWRLESRTAYDPEQEPRPEYEREVPYDVGQIYATTDEREPAEPHLVPAPYAVGHVPVADEAYEEPRVAPVHDETGLYPDADEWYEDGPRSYRTGPDARVGDDRDAEPWPAEQPYGVAPEYETGGYDESAVETASAGPVDSRGYSEDAPYAHERRSRGARAGLHRLADRDDDSEDDGAGHRGDERPVRHEEARDGRRARRERPRIRGSASPSTGRADRRPKLPLPLPVAVGLSALLGVTVVGWMVIGGGGGGGGGQGPGGNAAAAPPPASSAGATTPGEGLPSEAPVVVPGSSGSPPTGPSGQPTTQGPQPGAQPTTQGPQPGAQPTTQGPKPSNSPARTYNTALSGTGGTTCSREGGQWRVRISVAVTVSDPPPGVSPRGQGGPSGSMQSFSLSGGGSSFSGSTTVAVGPDSSPNVGTVQWVVTMTVPGGQTVRDENYEGYSCA